MIVTNALQIWPNHIADWMMTMWNLKNADFINVSYEQMAVVMVITNATF